jgi:hypothetical protein
VRDNNAVIVFSRVTVASSVYDRNGQFRWLRLGSLLDSLIQRLQHSSVHRGNHVNSGVQLFFSHPCFPCIRKAAFYSRVAEPHHRDRETDEHLLAFAEAFDVVGITVEGAKVGFLQLLILPRVIIEDPSIVTSRFAVHGVNLSERFHVASPVRVWQAISLDLHVRAG